MKSRPDRTNHSVRAALASLFAVTTLAACPSTDPAAPEIVGLQAVTHSLVLAVGETAEVRVEGVHADGSTRDVSRSTLWVSRKEAVASTGQRGSRIVLEAHAAGGTVLVASHSGFSAQIPVAVRATRHSGPFSVDEVNPRYFRTSDGQIIFLTGSHTWTGVQDDGLVDPPPVFDFEGFLDFIEDRGHNLVRLWAWEQATWATDVAGDYFISPVAFARTGPGVALDGKPKFDLDVLNDDYFERLRERLEAIENRDLHVAIMLFNGWSVRPIGLAVANPWNGHPFNVANNVNGIDGDIDGSGDGNDSHTLADADVTARQAAYVRRVVEVAADFEHVIYEISNESGEDSGPWQAHMMQVIRDHEALLGVSPSPVGMTAQWPGGSNETLFASPADWVSPRRVHENAALEPMETDGEKVILYDTDHLCGTCGEVPWVWKSVTRGLQPLFMDSYDNHATGLGAATDDLPEDVREAVRLNMGWARVFVERLDLRAAVPRPDIASTPYVLADLDGERPQVLAYIEDSELEIDLPTAQFEVEWFRTDTGETIEGVVTEGGAGRRLVSPVGGPVVLFLDANTSPGAASAASTPIDGGVE